MSFRQKFQDDQFTHGFILEWAAKLGNQIEFKDLDGNGFWQPIRINTFTNSSHFGGVNYGYN